MIIPIRCMSCGNLIADKWRFYQNKLKELKNTTSEQRVYFDGDSIPDTAEKKVLDMLSLKRSCCRKHFLTQVDLIDKLIDFSIFESDYSSYSQFHIVGNGLQSLFVGS